MKKLVKLFALALVSLTIFSCTTDEYDVALKESVKVTENIESYQSREGEDGDVKDEDIIENDSLAREENQPVIIVKKD